MLRVISRIFLTQKCNCCHLRRQLIQISERILSMPQGFCLRADGADVRPKKTFFLRAIPQNRATLLAAVHEHGKANGYRVVVKSSSEPTEKKPRRVSKIWLRCDRGGQYRPRNGLTEETRKRRRTSRLTDCPFSLLAAGTPGFWSLTVTDPTHNHGPVMEPAQPVARKSKKGQILAQPYDWPHDASFSPFKTALVVIDMQKDCKKVVIKDDVKKITSIWTCTAF